METPERKSDGGAMRKRYAAPELKEFGRIAELTRAVDMAGMMDGGTMGINRT